MEDGKPDCSETKKLYEAYWEHIDSLSVSISEVRENKNSTNIEINYNSIIKNIIFQEGDFLKEEKDAIRDAIKNLYFGSQKSRKIFDKISNLKNGEGAAITGGFYISSGSYDSSNPYDSINSSEPGGYSIIIDVKGHNNCDSIYAFNDKSGNFILFSLERTIMHETIHAVTGLTDEGYKTIYAPTGEVVNLTNTIMKELNANARPTYEADARLKDYSNQENDLLGR